MSAAESTPALTLGTIARVCHAANRAYCEVVGDTPPLPWDELGDGGQSSIVHGVAFVLNNRDAPDSAQHDAWAASRLAAGWKYGPVTDRDARIHANLVPFEQLPAAQQAKDRLFRAIVRALAPPPSS